MLGLWFAKTSSATEARCHTGLRVSDGGGEGAFEAGRPTLDEQCRGAKGVGGGDAAVIKTSGAVLRLRLAAPSEARGEQRTN